MPRALRLSSSASALLLVASFSLAGFRLAAAAQSATRIAPAPDESQLIPLRNNVPEPIRSGYDLGPIPPDTPLDHLLLTLIPSPAQQANLDELAQAQQDPGSPLYRQWLTPAEFGVRFGVGPAVQAQIVSWLQSHGFTIDEVAPSRLLIQFSGTAAQVAETFHTEIHRYQVGAVEHIANQQDPQIPAAFAGVIGGVVSLHNFRRTSQASQKRALPQYSNGTTHYLFPADWATLYNLNPLYAAGTSGSGASIAIVGRSNIHLADVASFLTAAGLPANAPSITLVGADPGLVSGDQAESTLDVEWSGAIAPAASVRFVIGASTATTDGIDLSAQYVVNHAVGQVVSTSYGSCEQDMGATELAFYNALWQQAAAQGMSVFVSSGDSGAAGCDSGSAPSGTGPAVNGLCTSPYATCVGGTEFDEGSNPAQYWTTANTAAYGSALGYIPEEVWNESALDGGAGLWASTGGTSIVYPQPAWQKAVAPTSTGMRAVPDIAFTAAAHDGYILDENGSFWVISGTSAASPTFAGVMALVLQSQGGTGQGNANPALYPLVNASRNPFHPTPSGNNSVPGVAGFAATGESYNQATGLGSVDAAALVASWPSASNPMLTLEVSPAQLSIESPATVAVTVTAVPADGLIIREVATHPLFAPSSSNWTGVRGGPVHRSPITARVGDPSIGIVSGLPAGITASWSAPSFTPSGSVAWTLTLAASTKAIARASTLNIGATVTSAASSAATTATAALPITVTLSPSTNNPPRIGNRFSAIQRLASSLK